MRREEEHSNHKEKKNSIIPQERWFDFSTLLLWQEVWREINPAKEQDAATTG